MNSRSAKAMVATGTAALSLMSALAQADASNYNYLQLDYQNGDTGEVDIDGWRATGSYRFSDDFFVAAAYSGFDLNEEIDGVNLDGDDATGSLGFIFAENATASIFGTAGYRRSELRTQIAEAEERETVSGYDLGLGARINLSPEAELRLGVNYADFGDGLDQTTPSVGLVYRFTRRVAGSAEYQGDNDANIMSLGFRFYF